MKYLILTAGTIFSLLSVVAGLISASSYGLLFIVSLVAGVTAMGCFVYLYRFGSGWFFAGLVPSILAFYSVSDVLLRRFAGIRMLDLLK